jgi:hypothetical protein
MAQGETHAAAIEHQGLLLKLAALAAARLVDAHNALSPRTPRLHSDAALRIDAAALRMVSANLTNFNLKILKRHNGRICPCLRLCLRWRHY